MTSSVRELPYPHTYRYSESDDRTTEVTFDRNSEGALRVTIETARLFMRSVEPTEEDIAAYAGMTKKKNVMKSYASGKTMSREEIEATIKNRWAKRWNENDPFSGFAVFKKDTKEFIGHVAIGHGDDPGEAQLGFLFKKKHWNQHFATEAVGAITKVYAPATLQERYTVEGKPVENITALASPTNVYSVQLLLNTGMNILKQVEEYGGPRHFFSIALSEIQTKLFLMR